MKLFAILLVLCFLISGCASIPKGADYREKIVKRSGMAKAAEGNSIVFGVSNQFKPLYVTDEMYIFSSEDEKAIWFCEFKFSAFGLPPTLIVSWYSPDDNLYKEDKAKIIWAPEGATAELPIKGTKAASLEGKWHLEVHWKGALADRQEFFIGKVEQKAVMGED